MKYEFPNKTSSSFINDQSVSNIAFIPGSSFATDDAGISFQFRNIRMVFKGNEDKILAIIDKVKAVSELSGTDTVKFEALVSLLMNSGARVDSLELVPALGQSMVNSRNHLQSINPWVDNDIERSHYVAQFYNK